jgi:hypothetical protein
LINRGMLTITNPRWRIVDAPHPPATALPTKI